MYYRILLTVDLTFGGKRVNHKAWALANHFDAKLYLAHVIEKKTKEQFNTAKEKLSQLGKELFVPEDCQFILDGSKVTEILRKADELEVDLIVVGNDAKQGILSSTATGILHDAKCDVMTILKK